MQRSEACILMVNKQTREKLNSIKEQLLKKYKGKWIQDTIISDSLDLFIEKEKLKI